MARRKMIRGGTVWSETGSLEADVIVGADGLIERLVERSNAGGEPAWAGVQAEVEVIDASGKWVLPGAIDSHVHFRDPGLPQKEDFRSGSAAAAVGGVTTVLDMPNTLPPVVDSAALAHKQDAVGRGAYVDYGLFGAATAAEDFGVHLARVDELVAAGVVGIKVFLGPTTGNLSAPTWGELHQLLAAKGGETLFVFHCEDRSVIDTARGRVPENLAFTYQGLLASRPRVGELLATDGVLRLARESGARVHVAHVALAEATAAIEGAKREGARVSAETCPQYLFLTEEDSETVGDSLKVLPPIRSRADQRALWEALASGTLDLVATDHAPHESASDEPLRAWEGNFGMAGVQTLVPLLIDAAIAGRCRVCDVVRWTSAAPARCFSLYPRKGALHPGGDADLTIVDPGARWQVERPWWQSRSENSAFWRREGRGLPVMTMLRGEIVARDGAVVGDPQGRMVARV